MGKAGRSMVEKKFDIKVLNKKLEYIFQKLKELQSNEFIDLESTEEIILKNEPSVVENVTEKSFRDTILSAYSETARSTRKRKLDKL